MSIESLMAQTCSVLRNTSEEQDEHGQPVQTWREISSDVPCWVSRRSAKEQVADKQAVVSEWIAFLEHGTDVLATDRIVCEGVTYEVKDVNPDPGNQQSHCQATLKAVT